MMMVLSGGSDPPVILRKLLNVGFNPTEWTYGLEVFIRFFGGSYSGVDLDGRGEVLIEDGER